MEEREDLINQIDRPLAPAIETNDPVLSGSIDDTDHRRNEDDVGAEINEDDYGDDDDDDDDDDEDGTFEMEFFNLDSGTEVHETMQMNRNRSIMSLERRQRILLGILFHRMMETQARRRTRLYWEDDDVSSSSESSTIDAEQNLTSPPIRCISLPDAKERNAVCRFCLETVLPPPDGEDVSSRVSKVGAMLLAPCSCTGSAEYVHVECLRQWQIQTTKAAHATVCNVCTTPYSLRPPKIRNDLVPAGSLLVFQDPTVSEDQTIFSKSVILMLRGGDAKTPMGVIINKPHLSRRRKDKSSDKDAAQLTTVHMRGGPVCGGRFGVVRNVLVHTAPAPTTTQQGATATATADENDTRVKRKRSHTETNAASSIHRELFPNVQVVYDDENKEPAMLDHEDFSRLETSLQQAIDDESMESSTTSSIPPHLFAFEGCCKWSKGQLKAELLRGSWGVCHLQSSSDLSSPNPEDLAKIIQDLMLWNTVTSDLKKDKSAREPSSAGLWERINDLGNRVGGDDTRTIPRMLRKAEWFRFHEEEEDLLLSLNGQADGASSSSP